MVQTTPQPRPAASFSLPHLHHHSPPSHPVIDHSQLRPKQSPHHLPYSVQHQLLTHAQSILELACYNWTVTNFPLLIKPHQYGHPEAIELTVWTRMIINKLDSLPEDPFLGQRRGIKDLQSQIHHLRHAAVHRQDMSVAQIENALIDAALWTRFLKDETANEKLRKLRAAVHHANVKMQLHGAVLKARHRTEMAELDGNIGLEQRVQQLEEAYRRDCQESRDEIGKEVMDSLRDHETA